jgi:hypothetical protein
MVVPNETEISAGIGRERLLGANAESGANYLGIGGP